jgi:primosomal protein N' (replication factor Y)
MPCERGQARFRAFLRNRNRDKKKIHVPAFSHIIKITVRARDEKKAIDEASALAAEIKGAGICAEVLGPAPAPVSRVRGYFRWNVLLKG